MRFFGYEWKPGAISWVLHRLTGIGISIFLGFHIWTQTKIYGGEASFNQVMEFYKLTIIKFGEIVLMGAIIFHALNGVRIVMVDFARGARYHKKLLWGVVALGAGLCAAGTWMVVQHM